jgi:hypothetical protein
MSHVTHSSLLLETAASLGKPLGKDGLGGTGGSLALALALLETASSLGKDQRHLDPSLVRQVVDYQLFQVVVSVGVCFD